MSENTYKQTILDMATMMTEAIEDADKFDRGQDAAGARLRALFLNLSKLCKEHRINIQDVRKTRKESK
jgi:hypothetical protein